MEIKKRKGTMPGMVPAQSDLRQQAETKPDEKKKLQEV